MAQEIDVYLQCICDGLKSCARVCKEESDAAGKMRVHSQIIDKKTKS